MNIKPTYQTNFKSSYPVVHWVAESNGSYAPVSNLKLVKKLQNKVIRMLNKPLADTIKPMTIAEQRTRAYIGACDVSYRNKPVVRSFYNRYSGSINSYAPVSYIISGNDVEAFDDYLCKNIGRAKGEAKLSSETIYTPKVLAAIYSYNKKGLNFVNNPDIRIKDKQSKTYVLHTKFEIVRNKLGKIKDYKFVDARFLPEKGKGNPFERM